MSVRPHFIQFILFITHLYRCALLFCHIHFVTIFHVREIKVYAPSFSMLLLFPEQA